MGTRSKYTEILRNIVGLHAETDGSSTDLSTGWEPDGRYIVSLESIEVDAVTVSALHAAIQSMGGSSMGSVGTWKDPSDGTIWIERIIALNSEREAQALARSRGEKYLYDQETGRSVPICYTRSAYIPLTDGSTTQVVGV